MTHCGCHAPVVRIVKPLELLETGKQTLPEEMA